MPDDNQHYFDKYHRRSVDLRGDWSMTENLEQLTQTTHGRMGGLQRVEVGDAIDAQDEV
jgi:hypothetical protein